MRLDNGSLAFNCPGCPSWGTAIVEQDIEQVHLIKEDIATNIILGIVHNRLDIRTHEFSIRLGKGSHEYFGDSGFENAMSEPILVAQFDKVFINRKPVDYPFLLSIIRNRSEAHDGRLELKYTPRIKYGDLSNEIFFKRAEAVLGIDENTPWSVHNIEVVGQEELHFYAITGKSWDEVAKKVQEYYTNPDNHIVPNPQIIKHSHLQQIFYGAPGTGKSHTVNETTEKMSQENVFRITFHPDSDYSTFVGCYKPTKETVKLRDVTGKVIKETVDGAEVEVTEDRIAYKFVPQSFIKAYVRAMQTEENVMLVIEEINRGNCAQIFGDMFQLLDRNEEGLSDYAVKPDTDLEAYLKAELGDKYNENEGMRLPKNLYIWATMNTSDQSLFPIDSAFKRRWEWKYMPIKDCGEGYKIVLSNGKEYDWFKFIEAMNEKIFTATSSEDKQMGYFFIKAENGKISADRFVNKVLFYLYNDVFKSYDLPTEFGNKKFTAFFTDTDTEVEELMKGLGLEALGETDTAETTEGTAE